MSITTDLTYLVNISHRLRNFKKKKDYLYNFSCPICGDSKKKLTKARGFCYRMKNSDMMLYRCHNCGLSTTFGKMLERVDSEVYKQYVLERYKQGETKRTTHAEPVEYTKVVRRETTALDTLKTVSRLSEGHPVRKYLEKRKIPDAYWDKLYLVNQFYKFVNRIIPNKFPTLKGDHPRLLIPFYSEDNKLIGFQGRAFGNETPKYLTIMLEDTAKIYGLESIDRNKPVFVVEGPIDSMFVDNAIAMAGADVTLEGDYIYVYDNEPRSPEIVKRMHKHIENGDKIVVWPDNISEKDINDMVIAGRDPNEVQDIISKNVFNGLSAKVRMSEWQKTT
jgi:transcription elongation factor Elf1